MSELQQQIVDIERQKQMVHEYLFSNNEAVSRVQREVDSASTGETIILYVHNMIYWTPLHTTCVFAQYTLNYGGNPVKRQSVPALTRSNIIFELFCDYVVH